MGLHPGEPRVQTTHTVIETPYFSTPLGGLLNFQTPLSTTSEGGNTTMALIGALDNLTQVTLNMKDNIIWSLEAIPNRFGDITKAC